MITKRQKQVLNFIKSFRLKNEFSPSLEEIKKYLKLSSVSTAHHHVKALRNLGYLKTSNHQSRAINIYESEQMISIPLLGTIAAGQPIEAVQERETIAVAQSKLPKEHVNIYALRVSGTSMIDENINDGDIILVKQQSIAENGQKVVALIDNHEATLKKFYKERGHIRLQPANDKVEPIILDKGVPFSIQGVFVDVIRKEQTAENSPNTIPTEQIDQKSTDQQQSFFSRKIKIASKPTKDADVVLFHGDRLDLLRMLPDKSVKLVVTSPPYNIGKEYEKRKKLDIYLSEQEETIREAVRVLSDDGSICWQVGNHIGKDGEVFPLDALTYQIGKKYDLKLRNRIIWHFGHGLHCTKRFSGRHETIVWFTKSDNYTFNLDPVRIPQKYPGKKNFKKNDKYGTLSCNPLGKNPSDIWEIPNVKNNHPEKTEHPCQFPIELIERLVLSMTNEGDIVLDPYLGVGSSLCAAIIHNRKGYGSDIFKKYLDIAEKRIKMAANGSLNRRLMGTPVYQPTSRTSLAKMPKEFLEIQNNLFGTRERTIISSQSN